ncbi:aromatic acid exporter family protein [Bacillus sp. RO1]|uniref:aromatic acid exporter family protein n=1 Tax=Bacillus sp. RO1 TaxID=2722703 RepID=UPI0014578C59|nr:aromatic acid exporter family protein [Bacillus sp. RO1]NLP51575.1 aromatic acid exporter family protein [Bacillus sp. RO1]
MRKFKIGYRTAKTALGTGIAISIAQLLNLDFYASAGIIAILCIQNTVRKSWKVATARFFACSLSLLFGFVFFELLGYNPVSIALLLLFFIPVTVMLRITEGIATSSVILLHVYSVEAYSIGLVINELSIIFIGIGVALIMNTYMPSVEKELKSYQLQVEENFHKVFSEIAYFLRHGDRGWGGQEIPETNKILKEAKSLAFRDVENHFRREENHHYFYFKMREKQLDVMERMLPIVASIEHNVEQAHMVADFIEDLEHAIHAGNTAYLFLQRLRDMHEAFQEMPLPQSREEFETRAALRHLLKEFEQYLILKSDFIGLETTK